MARTIITECPACFTRFKVTPGQLQLAAGKVRCGACLLVFKAGEPADKNTSIAPYNPEPNIDFGDIDLELDSKPARKKTAATTAPAKPARGAIQPGKRKQAVPAPRQGAQSTADKQALAKKMAAQKAEQKAAIARQVASIEAARSAPEKPEPSRQRSRTRQAQAKQQPAHKAPVTQTRSIASPDDHSANPLLDALGVEAIQLHPPTPPVQPLRTTGWSLAALIALTLLIGQYGWFERNTLAWQAPWHSLYRQACAALNCQLPTRQSITQIRSQQMLVQDHPDYQDALQIQLLLENTAPFDQPWPALGLNFTDLKGRTVAQRRFQPVDYLDLKSADPLTMPTEQPVQIRLEIMQPGVRAVSYALSIVKPDSSN